MTKLTKWHVRPAKTLISLGIHPVWSESLLSAWRKLWSLATHWAHCHDSDQTGRMPRLIWVFTGRTVILLVLSWDSSFFVRPHLKFVSCNFIRNGPCSIKSDIKSNHFQCFLRILILDFYKTCITVDTPVQGYRNFEIQIGPLDRWRHTDMRSTIPNSHEN